MLLVTSLIEPLVPWVFEARKGMYQPQDIFKTYRHLIEWLEEKRIGPSTNRTRVKADLTEGLTLPEGRAS